MQRFIDSGMSYEESFRTRLGQRLSKIQQHDLVVTPFSFSPSTSPRFTCVLKKGTAESFILPFLTKKLSTAIYTEGG